MSMWQKLKSIQIPGCIVGASLTGLLLGTTMVLFTRLPVAPPTVPTSVENTSGKNESLEILVSLPSGEELLVKVTGESTMEVVQSLKRILKNIVSYTNCLSGGYGLIQWTSAHRYRGLGTFCNKFACDPSSLSGQVRWMINEPIFQRVLPEFEGHGQTISQYMVPAYYWLGWGIKGNREVYAWDYRDKMVFS